MVPAVHLPRRGVSRRADCPFVPPELKRSEGEGVTATARACGLGLVGAWAAAVCVCASVWWDK